MTNLINCLKKKIRIWHISMQPSIWQNIKSFVTIMASTIHVWLQLQWIWLDLRPEPLSSRGRPKKYRDTFKCDGSFVHCRVIRASSRKCRWYFCDSLRTSEAATWILWRGVSTKTRHVSVPILFYSTAPIDPNHWMTSKVQERYGIKFQPLIHHIN